MTVYEDVTRCACFTHSSPKAVKINARITSRGDDCIYLDGIQRRPRNTGTDAVNTKKQMLEVLDLAIESLQDAREWYEQNAFE